jgi:hypothetical protein
LNPAFLIHQNGLFESLTVCCVFCSTLYFNFKLHILFFTSSQLTVMMDYLLSHDAFLRLG